MKKHGPETLNSLCKATQLPGAEGSVCKSSSFEGSALPPHSTVLPKRGCRLPPQMARCSNTLKTILACIPKAI